MRSRAGQGSSIKSKLSGLPLMRAVNGSAPTATVIDVRDNQPKSKHPRNAPQRPFAEIANVIQGSTLMIVSVAAPTL
jgi:hypothetical protein